ncbi:MAG: hypothetical protein WCS30_00075 [Selenomonadaceae bacterium]
MPKIKTAMDEFEKALAENKSKSPADYITGTIKLKHGIDINGTVKNELTYDFKRISADEYIDIEEKQFISGGGTMPVIGSEDDFQMKIMSVAAGIPFNDLINLKGSDIYKLGMAYSNYFNSADVSTTEPIGTLILADEIELEDGQIVKEIPYNFEDFNAYQRKQLKEVYSKILRRKVMNPEFEMQYGLRFFNMCSQTQYALIRKMSARDIYAIKNAVLYFFVQSSNSTD